MYKRKMSAKQVENKFESHTKNEEILALTSLYIFPIFKVIHLNCRQKNFKVFVCFEAVLYIDWKRNFLYKFN